MSLPTEHLEERGADAGLVHKEGGLQAPFLASRESSAEAEADALGTQIIIALRSSVK